MSNWSPDIVYLTNLTAYENIDSTKTYLGNLILIYNFFLSSVQRCSDYRFQWKIEISYISIHTFSDLWPLISRYNCTFLLYIVYRLVTSPRGRIRAAPTYVSGDLHLHMCRSYYGAGRTVIYHIETTNLIKHFIITYHKILKKNQACIKNIHSIILFTYINFKWSHIK